MALNVITWLWGSKYGLRDVLKLSNRLRDCLTIPYKFTVFTDAVSRQIDMRPIDQMDRYLMERSCFVRLRMFDPNWQKKNGFTDRIISIDLDNVIVGNLNELFAREESFMILKGVNSVNPNPFNASVMMLKCGEHPEVWSEFSMARASQIKYHEFPDDQGWIWHMLPNAAGWTVGRSSGIYGFKKPGWPVGSVSLPEAAKMVCFIGHRKPQDYSLLPWVRRYWGEAA